MADNINLREIDREEKVVIHDHGSHQHKTQVVEDLNAEQRVSVGRFTQLIWLFFGVLEALIGIRIVLKLLAANPGNPFAQLVYTLTDVFLKPFVGLTVTPQVEGAVFEISAVIAIFAYALLSWVLVRLVWLLFYHPRARSIHTVDEEHDYIVDK